jgi:hypothetical protein
MSSFQFFTTLLPILSISREISYEMAGRVTFGEQKETINFPGASSPPDRPQLAVCISGRAFSLLPGLSLANCMS